MFFPEPFPEEILNEIREYPGNSKCCDCGSLDTDWGSVSHGTLICLDCAGKHRSLGVHVSFVRSIRMDSWSKQQVEMMRQGGNNQIRRFFEKLEIENSPIQALYCTKGANHYRERLRERVDKIMSGEIKSEKRVMLSSPQKPSTNIDNDPSGLIKVNGGSPDVKTELFKILFGEGTMGMTLTKDSKERALVSRLVPGGPAQANGVKIGDYIIGVAGKSVNNYDEIMHMIPCMNRPLEILFNRVTRIKIPAKIMTSKSETFLDKHLIIPLESISDKSGNRQLFVDSSLNITRSQSMKEENQLFSPSIVIRRSKSSSGEEEQLEYNELESAITQLTKTVKTLKSPNNEKRKSFFASDNHSNNNNDNNNNNNNNNNPIEQGYSNINDDLENEKVKSEKYGGISLEPGCVIKVFRNNEKWKTAIIKRVHKDGSFKVAYRDGSVESHITAERVALTKSFFDKNGITIPIDDIQENSNYYNNNNNEYDEVNDDVVDIKSEFVADSNIDLDAWIENEDEESSLNRLSLDNNYPRSSSSNNNNNNINNNNNNNFSSPSFLQSPSSVLSPESVNESSVKEFKVIFQEPPLGLTLSVGGSGEPEVIKVLAGGTAFALGVVVGDVLIRVENRVVYEYDEVMSILPSVGYPLLLQFRRGRYKSIMENSSDLVVQSSKILATKLLDTMGMNKPNTSLLNAPTAKRLSSNRLRKETSPSPNGNNNNKNTISPLSKRLSNHPENNNEFDVIFEEVELGFRLDERIGTEIVSVVTNVNEKSYALEKGISLGCIVLGINYEKYISHAHTVATLKYAKRPVTIRFRK